MLFLLKDNFLSKVVCFLLASVFIFLCLLMWDCFLISRHLVQGSVCLSSSSWGWSQPYPPCAAASEAGRVLELPILSAVSISSSWFTCPDWGSMQWVDFTQVPGRCLVGLGFKPWSLGYKDHAFPSTGKISAILLKQFFFLICISCNTHKLLGFLLIFIFL